MPGRLDRHPDLKVTRIEYDLIRSDRPELCLPHWHTLRGDYRELVRKVNPDRLVARRTAKILEGFLHFSDDPLYWNPVEPEP